MQYEEEDKPFVIGSLSTSGEAQSFSLDDDQRPAPRGESTPARARPRWTLGLFGAAAAIAAVFLLLGMPQTLTALLRSDGPSKEEFAELQESHRSLTKLYADLEKESRADLAKLQGKLRGAEGDLLRANKAGQQATGLQTELKTARARIDELTRRGSETEQQLKEKDARIAQLQSGLRAQTEEHERVQTALDEANKRESAARGKAEALALERQEAEARIRMLEADKEQAVKLAREAAEVAEVSKEMAARAVERCRQSELPGPR